MIGHSSLQISPPRQKPTSISSWAICWRQTQSWDNSLDFFRPQSRFAFPALISQTHHMKHAPSKWGNQIEVGFKLNWIDKYFANILIGLHPKFKGGDFSLYNTEHVKFTIIVNIPVQHNQLTSHKGTKDSFQPCKQTVTQLNKPFPFNRSQTQILFTVNLSAWQFFSGSFKNPQGHNKIDSSLLGQSPVRHLAKS